MKRMTIALVLSAGLVLTGTPAEAAAPTYSSCAKLSTVFPTGVAKSKAAALRQVAQENSRPAFGPRAVAVYWQNYRNLDRDRDGTACEVPA